jgi:1,4-dihydroxy-2-naphthoate octaprenyltransferase
LRLHFQPLLAPIYLFGALVAADAAGVARPLAQPEVWLGALSLHVFLYGGTTAFNSYYDRDEGPVGGMLHPPPVDAGLLPFSLAVQAVGLLLALPVGPAFTAAWLLLFAVFTGYSHPSVRLKARTWTALAAIALGQGAVGFALAWLTLAPPAGLATPASALRMAVTALIVTGLYVVTQSYQVAEDRARGDRTLPVLLGPRRALRASVALLAPGGVVLLADLQRLAGTWISGATAVFFAGLAVWILAWSARFDAAHVATNYRVAMRVATTAGVGLGALLLALLAAR